MTSLPSRFGIGDFGPAATSFVTALSLAGQAFWQVLPLHPTQGNHHSPYHAISLFALNPLLISPEVMVQDGIIDYHQISSLDKTHVGFLHGAPQKEELLRAAASQNHCGQDDPCFEDFIVRNRGWL